ncbi:PEP-CTERM-box response regulator transcription factor [Porticoccus sp. GXU_MW_L64]
MPKQSDKDVLLIVEDDIGLQSQLKWHFEEYDVVIAANCNDAVAAVRLHEPTVILMDLGLPPDPEGVEEGFRCIDAVVGLSPCSKIIVMTGKNEEENALRAVANGAHDFYYKPVNVDTLSLIVERAYKMYRLEQQNKRLQEQQKCPLEGVIASDQSMLKVCRMVEKLAPADVTCTLLGESGTGKEVLAKALHELSGRSERRFVAINCAAVPENLMESELFGYEKGAFTGANKRTEGKIETAQKGTLFLDEIGDMPLNLQAKLLRFLQERVIERLGGREEIPVDVRVVCATNKNLEAMVAEGTFREDLYYRICEVVVDIPPLRDRQGDKILLARHFLSLYGQKSGSKIKGFDTSATNAIECHQWPGNIREMENKIKRAVIMAESSQITVDDLGLDEGGNKISLNLREVRKDAEKGAIVQALSMSDNNISDAAKLLGIARTSFYDLVKKYDISVGH